MADNPYVYYSPTRHDSPVTATVTESDRSYSVEGLAPGPLFTALNSPRAPSTIWVPTSLTTDGYPTTMVPVTTIQNTTGSVQIT